MKKIKEYRDLKAKEIIDKIKEFRKESLNLRFQKASGQLENTVRISVVRKEIARLKTIYNENFRKWNKYAKESITRSGHFK